MKKLMYTMSMTVLLTFLTHSIFCMEKSFDAEKEDWNFLLKNGEPEVTKNFEGNNLLNHFEGKSTELVPLPQQQDNNDNSEKTTHNLNNNQSTTLPYIKKTLLDFQWYKNKNVQIVACLGGGLVLTAGIIKLAYYVFNK